jgi:hypothetical protein
MNITYEKTKKKILAWCVEDWTPLFFVAAFVREFYNYKDLESVKKISLDLIKNLLEEELVVAGDLLEGNKFKAWNKKNDETLIQIKNKWDNLGRELQPHEIVWFDLTEKGRKEFEYLNSLPELKETDPFYFDDK